jgi:aspartate/methionine/tyrosine aminotransferase
MYVQGINPKGLVVINPGNPVGSVLTYEELKQLVIFCKQVARHAVWRANTNTRSRGGIRAL